MTSFVPPIISVFIPNNQVLKTNYYSIINYCSWSAVEAHPEQPINKEYRKLIVDDFEAYFNFLRPQDSLEDNIPMVIPTLERMPYIYLRDGQNY